MDEFFASMNLHMQLAYRHNERLSGVIWAREHGKFDSRLFICGKSLWVTLIATGFVLVFKAQLSGAKFYASKRSMSGSKGLPKVFSDPVNCSLIRTNAWRSARNNWACVIFWNPGAWSLGRTTSDSIGSGNLALAEKVRLILCLLFGSGGKNCDLALAV